jgi:antirestriction protein ArdC
METCHWTRHESRLDRDFGRNRWGDEGDAMEELVAELGSAFLSADLDLTPDVRDDHAAYLDHWLKVLKSDKRAIFTAAAHAQRACDFLHGLQPEPAPEPEEQPTAEAAPEPVSPAPAPASDPPAADTPPPGKPRQLTLF